MAENTKTESPVQVYENKDTIIGQPQSKERDPHDGSVLVHEVVVHTDKQILDPNDELAVQVPEGVGASTVGESPALSALKEGTAEEQFARARDEKPKEQEQVAPEETGYDEGKSEPDEDE